MKSKQTNLEATVASLSGSLSAQLGYNNHLKGENEKLKAALARKEIEVGILSNAIGRLLLGKTVGASSTRPSDLY